MTYKVRTLTVGKGSAKNDLFVVDVFQHHNTTGALNQDQEIDTGATLDNPFGLQLLHCSMQLESDSMTDNDPMFMGIYISNAEFPAMIGGDSIVDTEANKIIYSKGNKVVGKGNAHCLQSFAQTIDYPLEQITSEKLQLRTVTTTTESGSNQYYASFRLVFKRVKLTKNEFLEKRYISC